LLTEYTLAVGTDADDELVEWLQAEIKRAYRESRCVCGNQKERPRSR